MWILETDGDVFQGKRLWLRPGKRFLFGRTRTEGVPGEFAISDKTISRSHLIVEVSSIGSKDCENPKSRSTVTITDLATKIGTTLNGEQIRNAKDEKVGHTLTKDVNVIVLGKYAKEFRISWKPVVFTFSYTSKEHKANPYQTLYDRLGPLDVKVLVEYETQYTTHVAARKRNTAKGLQALIDGRYIVDNERYINELVYATTSHDGPSSLELDFDGNFPNELDFLPTRGDEPTARDASAYAPDHIRKVMFEGYTFVFYEQKQYSNLMAPITQGGGKALCHVVVPEKTQVLEFVEYVKNVAGEKGVGSFDDGSEGRGVVVVRYNPPKGDVEWYKQFNQEVSLQLDHRFIEQNEFLDAILGSDASVLRRPLDVVDASGFVAPPPSLASNRNTQVNAVTQQNALLATAPEPASSEMAAPEQPPTRGRGRRGAFKFKGFADDDDNFSSLPPANVPASQSFDGPSSSTALQDAASQGLFVSQDFQVDIASARPRSPTLPPQAVQPSRKRTAPSDDSFISSLAPTAAAIKRRKLAVEKERRDRGSVTPPPAVPIIKTEPKQGTQSPQPKPKGKKNGLTKEDDDAIEKARLKAEEASRMKREALEVALDGVPISGMGELAIIETMSIGRRQNGPARTGRADESVRWDEKWNGRKNFKKFKRRGDDGEGSGRRKVIVRLEEAKKKDYGMGDEYWVENSGRDKESQRRKKRNTQSQEDIVEQPQSMAMQEVEDEDSDVDEELAAAAAKIKASECRQSKMVEIPSSSDVEITNTHSTRSHPTSTQTQSQTQTQTQTLASKMTNSMVPAKRAAPTSLKGEPAAKKAGGLFGRRDEEEDEDDSDSDDGLGFKLRKVKRKGRA